MTLTSQIRLITLNIENKKKNSDVCFILSDCPVGWRLLKYWDLVECPTDYYSFETNNGITLHADDGDTADMIVDDGVVSILLLLFFFISGGHKSFFAGPLIPLLWTSGDVCPGFQRS